MPQLQIVEPQQGSVQVQPASREQFGRGGEAFMALSQQMKQFTQALDNVSKYRAEAAAASVDTQLQGLKQEMTANPNGLIGDAWQAEYDKRAEAIREKAAKTPFIHQGLFGQKAKTSVDIHRMELGAASTQATLASGKKAFDEKLVKLADNFARSDDPDERRLVQAQMEIAVHGAAADGIIMPTEREAYLRETRNSGYIGAFSRLNNQDPSTALTFVEEHKNDMPVTQAEALTEKAINESVARGQFVLAQERAARQRVKEFDRQSDREAVSRLTMAALTGQFSLDVLLDEHDNLSPENQKSWMTFGLKNPTGKPPAQHDDLPTAMAFELEIRGLDGKSPAEADLARKDLISRIAFKAANGELTQATFSNFLNMIEKRDINPVMTAVEDAVSKVTLLAWDKVPAGFSAKQEMRTFISQNPNMTSQQYWQKGRDILNKYDIFSIGSQQLSKPNWYVFDNGFQFQDSIAAVRREAAAGKITPEEEANRLKELKRYSELLEAQKNYEAFGEAGK